MDNQSNTLDAMNKIGETEMKRRERKKGVLEHVQNDGWPTLTLAVASFASFSNCFGFVMYVSACGVFHIHESDAQEICRERKSTLEKM